ncbi:RNase H domain-containing protein [Trichonephila clavipes]|nr:RNase H domain-containing protein [Trichonephila clavipes]
MLIEEWVLTLTLRAVEELAAEYGEAERSNHCRQIGLYAPRPVRRVPLTVTHCRLRLDWSREHALWTLCTQGYLTLKLHETNLVIVNLGQVMRMTPEHARYTSNLALETVHGIPHSALKIYTGGTVGEGGISGDSMHIGLQFIDTDSKLVFRDIWILTDSRASKEHLSRWTTVGHTTSRNMLDFMAQLFSRHSKYFQRVASHIGLNSNEIADSLVKSATADTLQGKACLSFTEISSIKRLELSALWGVPPAHPWYFDKKKNLVGVISLIFLGINKRLCHVFFSSHIKSITFQNYRKVLPE